MVNFNSVSILLNPSIPVPVVNKWRFTFCTDHITEMQGLLVEGFDSSRPAKTFSNFCVGCSQWFGLNLSAEIIGHEVIIKPVAK